MAGWGVRARTRFSQTLFPSPGRGRAAGGLPSLQARTCRAAAGRAGGPGSQALEATPAAGSLRETLRGPGGRPGRKRSTPRGADARPDPARPPRAASGAPHPTAGTPRPLAGRSLKPLSPHLCPEISVFTQRCFSPSSTVGGCEWRRGATAGELSFALSRGSGEGKGTSTPKVPVKPLEVSWEHIYCSSSLELP